MTIGIFGSGGDGGRARRQRLRALAALLALSCGGGKAGDGPRPGADGAVVDGGSGGAAGSVSAGGSGGAGGSVLVDGGTITTRDGAADPGAGRDAASPRSDAGVTTVACAPLPMGAGPEITVGPGADLPGMVAGAAPGMTFLLMDGTYPLAGAALRLRAAGVTLRSVSGDAAKVIIDGEYKTPEAVVITASDVTVAHVTITRAVDHPVHIYPETAGDVRNTRLYGLRLIDGGEQFVKVNPNGARTNFVDGGRLECSFLQLTEAGRPMVESLGGTSCYTGGIDVHSGRGWVVRSNRFEDIYCRTGYLAEHAVHFWTGSRDTVVENNVVVNCARGVGYGLVEDGAGRVYPDDPYPGRGYIGHYDGVIRNNVIYANVPQYDTGIELDQARGVRVYHNTVFAGPGATAAFSSIDSRFANTLADIRNNLVNRLTVRDGAGSNASNNREMVPAAYFTNVAGLDFHLSATATDALDKGVVLPEAGLDLDGQPHGPAPDLGADER
jgi:hypothetical protein